MPENESKLPGTLEKMCRIEKVIRLWLGSIFQVVGDAADGDDVAAALRHGGEQRLEHQEPAHQVHVHLPAELQVIPARYMILVSIL